MTQMIENNDSSSLKERKLFADELSFVLFIVPVLFVLLTIGTIVWVATIGPEMMSSQESCFGSWIIVNAMVAIPVFALSYPFLEMVDSSVCALVNSISDFKNIPSFTESPKLNVLLLVYGFKIRKFVSGGAIADLVIDGRIKHSHKTVEDILSEPAVVDVIKNGQSRHFKKDVVASVTEVIKNAIQEVGEISMNAKIEKHNKARKQNEESDQMVAEFLTRKK